MNKSTKESILVTCCIPSYNHSNYVRHAILSVIEQTYGNIELIIIDDGSKDKSIDQIERMRTLCEDRFSNFVFINRENRGLSATLNEMISIANGEFVTILASDDSYMPNKIELLTNRLNQLPNDYAAIFGDAEIIYNNDLKDKGCKSFITRYLYNNNIDSSFDVTYKDILQGNFIPAMSILYRKDAIKSVGGFRESLRLEDWDMYLRLLHSFKIRGCTTAVAYYYLHGENSIFKDNYKLLKDTIEILKAEKVFSFSIGLENIWFRKYYDTLISILRKEKKISYITPYLNNATFTSIISYFIKKIIKRFN